MTRNLIKRLCLPALLAAATTVLLVNCSGDSIGGNVTGKTRHPVPTGVEASYGEFLDRIAVWWDTLQGVQSYRVYRADSSAGVFGLVAEDVSDTFYVDSSVTSDRHFYYRVTSIDNGGTQSDLSEYVVGLAGDTADSAFAYVPRDVRASDGISPDSIVVTWQATRGAIAYSVYRLARGDSADVLLADSLTATSFADTTAGPGLGRYRVSAIYQNGVRSARSRYDSGYRLVTNREFLLDYNNSSVYTSQHKMTLLVAKTLGTETVAGEVSGVARYNAFLPTLGTAQIDIGYTNYCDDYLTLNGTYTTVVGWITRSGDLTGMITVTGIYGGTIEYHVVISDELPTGGYYRVTQTGRPYEDITYVSVEGELLY
jgi:hypothetical protein